jgi:hypothetical protein
MPASLRFSLRELLLLVVIVALAAALVLLSKSKEPYEVLRKAFEPAGK